MLYIAGPKQEGMPLSGMIKLNNKTQNKINKKYHFFVFHFRILNIIFYKKKDNMTQNIVTVKNKKYNIYRPHSRHLLGWTIAPNLVP